MMPRCSYCNSNMIWGEGLVEDGKWIEEKCWKIKLLKRISILEKKTSTGKITMEEAIEYKDDCQLLENQHNQQHEKNEPQPNIKTDRLINKIRFGKRVDTQDMLKSGELNEMLNFTEINIKPKMNAIYCASPENIIPYSEQKLLESEKIDMQPIKNHEDALQTKKRLMVRVNNGVNS